MLLCFAIFDHKAGVYNTPFFMRTKGEALRGFMDLVSDPQTSIAKYPEDFSLFQLSSFVEQSGEFVDADDVLGDHPHRIATALDFVKKD